jgi:hypothetical protein
MLALLEGFSTLVSEAVLKPILSRWSLSYIKPKACFGASNQLMCDSKEMSTIFHARLSDIGITDALIGVAWLICWSLHV